MSLISFDNISKFYGSDLILDHVSFSINKNERVALVGSNGTGKTTIFKLILKKELPTNNFHENKLGEINILKGLRIGYLDQNAISDINNTVYQELLIPFTEVIKLKNKADEYLKSLNENPNEEELNKYNDLVEKISLENGYDYDFKIKEMLSRFNLNEEYLNKELKYLSGGERMKVAFSKILLEKYDVLLLDEPTNHLDIGSIEWLENFLKSYKGTIFFISHDRYFLEALANKIIELDNHKVTTYNTDYNNFLILKENYYNLMYKEAIKQQKEIEKLKRFIEFYKPKPRFVSRAKDREKKLAKIEKNLVEVPSNSKKQVNFNIKGGNLENKKILEFNEVVVGYLKPLIKEFSLMLFGKDRLAIVGDNGIGKTTLIKSIIGEIKLLSGEIKQCRLINFGYVKQNDYSFSSSLTALEYLKEKYPLKTEKEIRNILGKFLFTGEDVFKNIALMSNGEKMRLIICDLSFKAYDILLLDEPTNHLDLETKESLIEALKAYEGAIIFVSHDRYFINEIANKVLFFSKNKTLYVEGDYEDLKNRLDKEEKELKSLKEIETKIYEVKRLEKLSNNKIKEYLQEIEKIEARLQEINEIYEQDFESMEILDKLNEEESELEFRYLEIMDILEKDKKCALD